MREHFEVVPFPEAEAYEIENKPPVGIGFAVKEVEVVGMQNVREKQGQDEELAVRHWRDWAEVGRNKKCACLHFDPSYLYGFSFQEKGGNSRSY